MDLISVHGLRTVKWQVPEEVYIQECVFHSKFTDPIAQSKPLGLIWYETVLVA